MLNLVVQKTVEEISHVAAGREVDGADDLPEKPFAPIAR